MYISKWGEKSWEPLRSCLLNSTANPAQFERKFWTGPKRLGWVQIRFFWTNFCNLDILNMILTQPKQIGPVQNHFLLTERQVLNVVCSSNYKR